MIEFRDGMLCPACVNGNLTGRKLDLPWKFGKHKTVFEDATVFNCDNCPESFFDKETNDRVFNWVEEVIDEFGK